MQTNQWPEAAVFVAGGCLAASPWLMGSGDAAPAVLYNALGAGLALALLALANLLVPKLGPLPRGVLSLAKLVVGLWAVASPWALAFASQREITIVTAICGGVAAAVALWQIVDRYQHTHHLFE